MLRLCWKEWRERWPWLVLLFVAMVGTAVTFRVHPLFGENGMGDVTMMISVLAAGLAGASAYAAELARPTFAAARPIGWGRLLLAKVIPGLVVILLGLLISTLAAYLLLPADYQAAVTGAQVRKGVMIIALITGLPYLIGFACAVALPGIAGGLLVGIGWAFAGVSILTGILTSSIIPVMELTALTLPPVFAAIILTRHGITLSTPERFLRFTGITAAVFAGLVVLAATLPIRRLSPPPRYYDQAYISPDATVALVRSGDQFSLTPLVNGTPTAHYPLKKIEEYWDMDRKWLQGNRLLLQERNPDPTSSGSTFRLTLVWLDGDTLRRQSMELSMPISQESGEIILSPDERRVLAHDQKHAMLIDLNRLATGDANPTQEITIPEEEKEKVEHARRQPLCYNVQPGYWWEDAHTVGYAHPLTGTRILFPVK